METHRKLWGPVETLLQTADIVLPTGLIVGWLRSRQHASVSQGWIYTENYTCCHTEKEVAGQTFYLIQSQYTDSGPTSPQN